MVGMLYGWFFQEILGFLCSLAKNRAQAEDLTQDTFMRAMAHAHQLSGMDKPACRAWLYTTAKNLFVDSVRKQNKNRQEDFLPEPQAYQQDFSAVLVEQMLKNLSWEDRHFIRLRYLEGYNASQIGQMYNLSPATVRTRLHRAKAQLKEALAQEEGESIHEISQETSASSASSTCPKG